MQAQLQAYESNHPQLLIVYGYHDFSFEAAYVLSSTNTSYFGVYRSCWEFSMTTLICTSSHMVYMLFSPFLILEEKTVNILYLFFIFKLFSTILANMFLFCNTNSFTLPEQNQNIC